MARACAVPWEPALSQLKQEGACDGFSCMGMYANSTMKIFIQDRNVLRNICKVLNLCYKGKQEQVITAIYFIHIFIRNISFNS